MGPKQTKNKKGSLCMFHLRMREFIGFLLCLSPIKVDWLKVNRSKGKTLFIVYVQPSKNKLEHLRKTKYLLTHTYCVLFAI